METRTVERLEETIGGRVLENGDWSWYRGVGEFASAKLWKSCELKRLAVAVAVSVAVE